jgi:hypothetical protein
MAVIGVITTIVLPLGDMVERWSGQNEVVGPQSQLVLE